MEMFLYFQFEVLEEMGSSQLPHLRKFSPLGLLRKLTDDMACHPFKGTTFMGSS